MLRFQASVHEIHGRSLHLRNLTFFGNLLLHKFSGQDREAEPACEAELKPGTKPESKLEGTGAGTGNADGKLNKISDRNAHRESHRKANRVLKRKAN